MTFDLDLDLLQRFLAAALSRSLVTMESYDILTRHIPQLISLGGAFLQTLSADDNMSPFTALVLHCEYWKVLQEFTATLAHQTFVQELLKYPQMLCLSDQISAEAGLASFLPVECLKRQQWHGQAMIAALFVRLSLSELLSSLSRSIKSLNVD